MANNSLTNNKGGVSYLQVYKSWLLTDKRRDGDFTIPIKQVLHDLLDSNVLTKSEYQEVYHEITDGEKVRKLFYDYMPAKGDEGFSQVVDTLNGNKNFDLAKDLIEQMEKCLSFLQHLDDTSMAGQNQTVGDVHASPSPKPTASPRHAPMKVQNSLMKEAQEHLSKFIILNIDFMVEFWSDKLLVSNTWSAYTNVQILEDFKDDRGKAVPNGDYVQVFENVSKTNYTRILIQGDPGCGKSTYVNKVALDWANENEYLRNKFHLVFLISLQTLEVGIEQAIRNLLPQRSLTIKFVEDYYKSHSSKVLLILDGFDEFPEDCKFYTEVMNMMKGGQTMSQFSFFTTIVTSRRSHVDKVPKRFHARSLLIKGFDEQSMKLFLQTQKVPAPDEQTDPNLVVLLQNPFFCAIYVSLYYFGVDKSNLKDPYYFVKALVENAVKNEKEAKRITNEEDQLLLLGAFAFQKLNSETLNVVEKLFPIIFLSEMPSMFKPKHVPRIDTDKIQLGLLIKKKIPTVGVEYKEEFSFPNQQIAECLAAQYFIRSTKSQLKQLKPEKLVQGELSDKLNQLILSSPSSLPFVRFLLFEYLNSYWPDERNSRELIFHLWTDEVRFICYCKSNHETPTINDITSLDCTNIDSEIRHDSQFFPTLAKCNQLKSLVLVGCNLSTHEATDLVNLFQKKCFPKMKKFDLSHNSNVGSKPALFTALGKCKQLKRLDLQFCSLSIESINQLTTCIDNCLVKLSQLNLSGNSNVGSTPALFAALGKCKQFEKLYLGWCDLSIESINRLATCIDNCWVKLSQLDLSGNSNVGSTPALFTALGKCKQLERLDLQSCSLSIESINQLATCIDNCWVKLSQLDLSLNSKVGSTPALFAVLGKCKQLERLDLQSCSLSSESINRLATCIDNCWVKLSQLDLSLNSNVGSTSALFPAFGKCKQLEKLYLGWCDLSIESINQLTTCIDNNCWVKLSQLDLTDNSNVGSTPAFFAALGKCKQLERLDLQQCSLSIESINRLATCIDNCWVKLSQLDLSLNRNVGSTPALFTVTISQLVLTCYSSFDSTLALFAALGKCKQLKRLDLRSCSLSIESINRLTTCMDNCCEKLSQLDLSLNSNVGSTPALFPAFGKCKQLEKLYLGWCDLSIESINQLTTCIDDNCWVKLSQLDLTGNSNIGSTPVLFAALVKCNQLERLDLGSCDLSIESINQLATCINVNCWVKLSKLGLTGNSNVGSTPVLFAALVKYKQLERLDLGWCDLSIESINQLTTCINVNCWVKLSQLDLSGNSNVGSTPALFTALGKCKQLERLDLQSCSLSIESINQLATCIDNGWVKLSQLDLSLNSNVGSTPALFAALGKCKQHEKLDLQSCSLSIESINRLATCIDNCCVKLSQLDLSLNSNVDSTPALFPAFGKCKQLEKLYLGWCDLSTESINQLTTCIDDNCWMKLSQLDLTDNSNVGSTPAFFAALGKCKQLERLDLQSCSLSIESINRLATCIDNCWVKLSQLDLSLNSNVGSTPALFAALGKCKQLERLDLQSCSLSIESINRLATCIDNCWVKLSQLDLSLNSNVGSTPALFAALGKCKQLERLDLQSCSLSIESINRLATCIDSCWVKLSQLDLSLNSNVGSTPALFAALGKCKQLERLGLQSCSLSIESINRLATCIDNCWVKLSQLDLSLNSNVGSTPALFPAFGKCKQLEKLYLGWCDLSIESINQLTTCIDNNCWVKLSQLDLTDNSNVGSTPAFFAALGKCKQLERLDLGWCDLSIESISQLTTCINVNCWVKLSQLDLTGNSDVGSTPVLFATLVKCKQLERLDLGWCDLSIESISQLTTCINVNCWVKLSQLDLTGNSDVGSTPVLFAALVKCKQLERLDLRECSLSIESINQLTTCIDDLVGIF